MVQSRNPWLQISQPKPNARLRLFCFPYAGGAASIYRSWHQYLPADVEVCAIQLPGRENRVREQSYINLLELVNGLLPNLLPYLDKPFALFGHSMGSLIAYEVAQQVQQGSRRPTHLLVSGRRAPVLPEPEILLHTLPTDAIFLNELQRRYNNLPTVMFEDAEFRQLFLPLLRADFSVVETYQYTVRSPLPCPIIALGGADDPRAAQAELQAWQPLTRANFALHLFPGGHFYLNDQLQPLLATVAGYLGKKVM